jgi:hypothetical protein
VGVRIDINKDCLTNPLDGTDVEERVGHCHLRVIPRDMDWAVPPPEPPCRNLVHFYISCYSSRYLQEKGKFGKDVGVWYIPTRHVKLEL